MKLSISLSLAAAAAILVAAPPPVQAQLEMSTIRGVVLDEKGQPIADVQIGMDFKGESRAKVAKTAATDKKGAYIKAGLRNGDWELTFTKEGFHKHTIHTYVSGGIVSEIPPVTLAAGESAPAPAAGGAGAPTVAVPATPAASGGTAGGERAKQVSVTFNKAVEAMKTGKADEAEALFKSAVAEMPELAEAHTNLGYIYIQRNDNAAAEAEFRKVVELRPTASAGYLSLAAVLAGNKRDAEALKMLKDAAPGFTGDARFQFGLGATAFNLNESDTAEAAFKKVTELDPTIAEAYFFLGSLALNRGDVPAAIERLEKYLTAAPPDGPNVAAAKSLLTTLKKK